MKPEPLSFLMRRFQKEVAAAYGDGGYRMPIARMAVLDALHRNRDTMNQTALCEASGTDRSSLSVLLPGLIDQDYVYQLQSKADRRANVVGLTAAGKNALDAAREDLHSAERAVLQRLPITVRRVFEKALVKLAENP